MGLVNSLIRCKAINCVYCDGFFRRGVNFSSINGPDVNAYEVWSGLESMYTV